MCRFRLRCASTVAEIELERVTKVYPDGTQAVAELDMTVGDGELVVFVGPSGCGKTSALRMIAGLEDITDGTIRIGGDVVNDLPPKDRDVAMVFQNYALYPHMTAEDNMAFALRMRGLSKEERTRRVREAARLLGLSDVLRKRPRTLSGGQRQRVAMGRAIVREPQAFLMDEPLSNLDAKLRVQMRAEIARIQRDLSVTTIYVTHDQSEAMTLGDRVLVLRRGELQQLDTPQTLYGGAGQPLRRGVHRLAGDEPGRGGPLARRRRPRRHVRRPPAARGRVARGRAARARLATPAAASPSGMRPEDLEDASLVSGAPEDETFEAVVDIREDMGSEIYLHFAVAADPVTTPDVREAVEDAARRGPAGGGAAARRPVRRARRPGVARAGGRPHPRPRPHRPPARVRPGDRRGDLRLSGPDFWR